MTYRKPPPEKRCQYKDVVEKWRGGCHNKALANGFCHVHGGKKQAMTPAQIKIARILLERAADEFSNHGCNDFDLIRDGKLTKEEAKEIQGWINTHPDFKNDPNDVNSPWAMDWLLMRLLGEELLNGLSPGPTRRYVPIGAVPLDSGVGERLTPGCYQHFKGRIYAVTSVATHSETEETMVVYMSEDGRLWVRPLAMFTEPVVWPDGVTRPRFRRMG